MKKLYSQPELEIKKYKVLDGVFTTSDPENNEDNDLNTDDNYDYFG